VLRTQPLGEADRLVVLLSPDEGRIEGVAAGVRRFRNRAAAALEPLTWVRAHYRERPGRDLVRIERIELLRSSFDLLSDPDGLAAFAHVTDLALSFAVAGEGRPEMVRLMHALLDACRAAPVAERAVCLGRARVYFDVWVARLEGFWPPLDRCAHCGQALSGRRRVGIHSRGAICAMCVGCHSETTLLLGPGGAVLAARIQRESPARFVEEPVDAVDLAQLERVALTILGEHLEREIRTVPAGFQRPRQGR